MNVLGYTLGNLLNPLVWFAVHMGRQISFRIHGKHSILDYIYAALTTGIISYVGHWVTSPGVPVVTFKLLTAVAAGILFNGLLDVYIKIRGKKQ